MIIGEEKFKDYTINRGEFNKKAWVDKTVLYSCIITIIFVLTTMFYCSQKSTIDSPYYVAWPCYISGISMIVLGIYSSYTKTKYRKYLTNIVHDNNHKIREYKNAVYDYLNNLSVDYVINNINDIHALDLLMQNDTGIIEDDKTAKINPYPIYTDNIFTYMVDLKTFSICFYHSNVTDHPVISNIVIPIKNIYKNPSMYSLFVKFNNKYGDKILIGYNMYMGQKCIVLYNREYQSKQTIHQSFLRSMVRKNFGVYIFDKIDFSQYCVDNTDMSNLENVQVYLDEDKKSVQSIRYNDYYNPIGSICMDLRLHKWVESDKINYDMIKMFHKGDLICTLINSPHTNYVTVQIYRS